MLWLVTGVLARVVVESGSPPPMLVADDAVLIVQRHDVVVGEGCNLDGGVPADSGTDDAGPGDAGVPPDAATCPPPGDAVTMVLQPRFEVASGGSHFALLLVTPSRPVVETQPDPFEQLAAITGPYTRIDKIEVQDPALGEVCPFAGGGGCAYEAPETDPPGVFDPPGFGDAGLGDGGVVVEHIGPYDVVRVQPADGAELAALLTGLGYVVQQADLDAVSPYIARGFTVVALRIAIDRGMMGSLAPIALTWAGSELRIPAALSTGDTPITVYIAADGRYQFPGAAVEFAGVTSVQDSGFLTRNELLLVGGGSPDDDPVATHAEGDVVHREEIVVTEFVSVPVTHCGGGCGSIGCRDCSTTRPARFDVGVLVIAVAFVLRRKRRRR